MPTYKVKQYRDAWQVYHATVTADTPEQAHALAHQDRIHGEWLLGGVVIQDDRHMEIYAEDDVACERTLVNDDGVFEY